MKKSFNVPRHLGRRKTRDMMTYDAASRTLDAQGNMMGCSLGGSFRTHDGKRTVDSTGAFLVGELERLDQKLHEPLASVTWERDITLREDVTIADEVSSFTLSTYGSQGGAGAGNGIGNGKAWIGKTSDQITGVGLDIAKIPHPLNLWGSELKYTIPELASAAKLGRPIDQQKFAGMQLKHQMDIDEQVYIGDITTKAQGLVNNDVSRGGVVSNVANVAATGTGSSPLWSTKTPAQILDDVNEIIVSAWSASAYAVMPEKLLLPPTQFGMISTKVVSDAGSMSILKYLQENSVLTTSGRGKLDIQPSKWLVGAGVSGTIGTSDGHDRMVAYTNQNDLVRYPMTMLQRTPVQFESIYHKTTYFCRLGQVEVVYPETIAYRDGL